jgi:hypothetical protein
MTLTFPLAMAMTGRGSGWSRSRLWCGLGFLVMAEVLDKKGLEMPS